MNQPYVSPVMVPISPMHSSQSPKYAGVATPAPVVTAIPVQVQPPPSSQFLQITIPEGYPPGSTLTVTAPNGQQVAVRYLIFINLSFFFFFLVLNINFFLSLF